jgi:hypothetical protein
VKAQPAARKHRRQRPWTHAGRIDHQALLNQQAGERDLADEQDQVPARAAPGTPEKWIE